ncbi:hypothetical protein MY04_5506 [Flammeovirga sp. MY04]|uniref:hypothetical protein n=1 Tax=Flammeovirga sp. MY04 TaxID=1191459 RepID=UPI0008061041|nr:hypothetical protein [Flammeovirga sp. MY04]ANQ52837.1 hypothetical protein MY04_5506 [Flammeovirga sp. MY04]
MNKKLNFIFILFIVIILTILTQVGGVVLLISIVLADKLRLKSTIKKNLLFFGLYLILSFSFIPFLAHLLGRERIINTEKISPTNYMTVLLNRNYVTPEMNKTLAGLSDNLSQTDIKIKYLDANFPFINGFPLLPHLSHNDGNKLDISLVYQTLDGQITDCSKSISGYGVFEDVIEGEINQPQKCLSAAYFQYDYPKYLTLGQINLDLKFSEIGTRKLLLALIEQKEVKKIFIEPHLKNRLRLSNKKIRYHGCRAVRHDDHIHFQI